MSHDKSQPQTSFALLGLFSMAQTFKSRKGENNENDDDRILWLHCSQREEDFSFFEMTISFILVCEPLMSISHSIFLT
jgi:hypothetical protein